MTIKEAGIPCNPRSIQEIRTLATAIYSMEDTVLGQYAVEKHNEQLQQKLANEAMRTAQMERRLQEARLKALQAQINPHFLYNTLNMIGQMSYIEGAERTTELIETFPDFFRYNVESFERDVTLREEIDGAKGYAALRTLRERAEETRGDDQSEHVSIGITNVISRTLLFENLLEGVAEAIGVSRFYLSRLLPAKSSIT